LLHDEAGMSLIARCGWCSEDPLYQAYHDHEWGRAKPPGPKTERYLFEMLILEGAQAGLSWLTVLKKRDTYRAAFDDFDAEKVARYTPAKIEKLLLDPGIIRNRAKVNAAVGNARAALQIRREHGSLHAFLWAFVQGKSRVNHWKHYKEAPVRTEVSDAMSKALQGYGMKFVGSTICYAFMQATGMVDDHEIGCHVRTNAQQSAKTVKAGLPKTKK
jgi:DNA-3-methyladenine glycosylase I